MTYEQVLELIGKLSQEVRELKTTQQETDKQIKELATQIGGLGNKFGRTDNRSKISEIGISDAEIEAVCGLYQADCTVSLEKMEEAIVQGALNGRY